ncbi:tetratricopeptide repeat protein [Pseudomonas sp. FME51]|uniref:tetratricopeptide repeat protein n=1 Tax=Pseudomonas sp. FME51 TaxID=2742609 RepID=UPI001866C734|nr:tetratricopeptide repeat protein [Pseudomonas sp. FME51]
MIKRSLWLLVTIIASGAAWQSLAGDEPPPSAASSSTMDWVDETSCQGCHAEQYADWLGSHHQLAMQPATDSTVLGNFDQQSLTTDTETSRFFHRDEGFWINTPNAEGKPTDYKVAYTFGVEPLQQYFLQLNDGRLQSHGAAWDVPEQRWFHLYDGEGVDHHHRLHWSGAQQNADYMCIECHTTGFQRDYDPVADTYASRWEALGVGCQSCHGPAAGHVQWAEKGADNEVGDSKGFEHNPVASASGNQPESCARCHSRRMPLGNGHTHGNQLLDDYLPVLLTADLYEVDGKIKDEVFEYGSFQQSRMHAAGVVCSDCHNPHSAQLRAPANAVCTQCHNPSGKATRPGIDASGLQAKNYDHPSHHHHPAGSAGSQCVSCHMPGKLYMVNDLRHDHSFTSPNPMQARQLEHSDACLGCHQQTEDQVVSLFQQWYPDAQPRDGGYARDLHAARQGLPGAADALARQLARTDLADIRRATLLSELPSYPSIAAQRAVVEALDSSSAQVRHTAAGLLGALVAPQQQVQLLTRLLEDSVRAVRLEAAWQLLQLAADANVQPQVLRQLIAEYEQSQNSMLERAESQLNLAGIYQLTGREAEVEPALRKALQQDPTFHPARIMLAQLREQAASDPEAALSLLREGIEQYPQDPSLQHALGLALVRQRQYTEALTALRQAHELAPEQPDYAYVLAVALHGNGQVQTALELLRSQLEAHPTDRRTRQALISYLRSADGQVEADSLLVELAAQNPDDPLLRQLGH